MHKRTVKILLVIALFPVLSNSQTILGVVKGYVMIDTDAIMGQPGQTFPVKRLTPQGVLSVGNVQLKECKNGRSYAYIVEQRPSLKIQKGDFLELNENQTLIEYDINAFTNYYGRSKIPIVKRVAQYVLFSAEKWLPEAKSIYSVYRQTPTEIMELGQIKVLETKNGQVAAEIITQDVPVEIEPNDFIYVDIAQPEKYLQPESQNISPPLPRPSDYLGRITNVTENYVLIRDIPFPEKLSDQLIVKRETEIGSIPIGIIEISIRKSDYMAAKILESQAPMQIAKGDYVTFYEKPQETRYLSLEEFLQH